MLFKCSDARRVWLTLHLYLALFLGFFFAVLGLTGSLSLIGEDLDSLLNPRLWIEPQPGQKPSLDEVLAAVQQAHPDYKGPWTLELPRSAKEPLTAWFEKPLETRGQAYAPLMVSVNPYTAEVLASRFWGETVRTWVLDLHSQLHLGRLGAGWVGLLGLFLIVSVLSGLYLWWPGRAGLRAAFRIRHQAGMNLFLFDLHRFMGLLGAVALMILGFTGFNLAYPALGEAIVGTSGMSHDAEGPSPRSTGMRASSRPVSLEEAVLLARGPFPHAEVRQVTTPAGPEGTFRVTFRQAIERSDRHPMTAVWVDQYSGHILEVRNAARFTSGETLLTAIWPLHTGEMLGGGGRLVWFLSGLLLPALYVTGLVRWLIGRKVLKDVPVNFTPCLQRWRLLKHHVLQIMAVWGPRILAQIRVLRELVFLQIRRARIWWQKRASGR